MRDLYEVLGVSRSAEPKEIRTAYKKLAREFHPDRNDSEEAADRFKEINAAYDVLGDKERRELYDEYGEISLKPGFDAEKARAWKQAGGGGGFGGGFPGGVRWSTGGGGPDFSGGFAGGQGFEGVDPEDLLGSIFGGGRRRTRRGPPKGDDIRAEVTVSLRDVAHGRPVEISLRRPVRDGDGLRLQQESLKVRLPPAVEDGRTIRLRGKGGESPHGGRPGDLLLEIHVAEEPGLRRDGDNLELDLPLTFAEALIGASVTVPTLDGDVKVKVPAGAQTGQKLRLRAKGMALEEGRGDLILVLRPTPPPDGGEEAEALAERLAALYPDDVRADVRI